MATKAAAIPLAVWKKRRRVIPRRRASTSAISTTRAWTRRCSGLCGEG
jgi:hypothetical protein